MLVASLLAQETSPISDAGGGSIILWVLGAGIIGLYFIIYRTRKRSYRDYMSREDREAEMKANDPDMKQD